MKIVSKPLQLKGLNKQGLDFIHDSKLLLYFSAQISARSSVTSLASLTYASLMLPTPPRRLGMDLRRKFKKPTNPPSSPTRIYNKNLNKESDIGQNSEEHLERNSLDASSF